METSATRRGGLKDECGERGTLSGSFQPFWWPNVARERQRARQGLRSKVQV